ncbi:TonB family protein [Neolewinella aurantiaca]|uniref:TonB family protein n=1 Tax=Neolewinella aurantiaca TaxID=2602767 RepID=A0A5C7FUG8_9BACT|nr:TonB family protein [Neolewinella aurantiaca]TXF91824.1 TonB family protein [Neolewinella aurantiaca]
MEIQVQSEAEQNGDRNGKVAAGIGFILFVIVLLIPIFFKLNPPPGQPGIAVLLAFDDQGSGDNPAGPSSPSEPVTEPQPVEPPPPAPEVKPEPVPEPPKPSSTPKPVVEQRDVIQEETAQDIAIRKQKAQEEARKRQEEEVRRREEAAAQAARDQAAKERREQEAREQAIREANAKAEAERQAREARAQALRDQLSGGLSGSGSGSGDTGKPGTQGRPDGVNDGSGIVAGSGRVSGGLGGRGLVSSPAVRESSQKSGTVIVEVCVGADGKVTTAKFTQSGSTTADPTLVKAAVDNAKTWKFSSDATAPPSQCGRITYTFKVQ